MAQSAKRHLPVDGAKQTGFSGTLSSLRGAEIKGFLCQYAMAESPYLRLVPEVCRSKRLTIDESDFIRPMERMVNTREEVEATPNELEVFRKARGVRLLVEHEASEDLDEDLAGTDVALHGVEATTSAQVRLGQPSGTHEILTQEGAD